MATEITGDNLQEAKLNGVVSLREAQVGEQTVADTGSEFYYEPKKDARFLLYIRCDHDSNAIDKVTVKAGDYFQSEILGSDNDLVEDTNIGTDEAIIIGPLESARFKDEDGKVNFEAEGDGASTARISVIEISYEE